MHLDHAVLSWIAYAPNRGWTVQCLEWRLQCLEWRLQASIAHDHCCVNFCSNDKLNKNSENLSFFNFPLNDLLRSKWIAATRRDEGPNFDVSRVETGELLDTRVIGDRLFFSIEDSASSF